MDNGGEQDAAAGRATNELPKLAKPARRALEGAGITSLYQLSAWSESEVRKKHGMGPKALNQLRGALATEGLSFAHPDTAIAVERSGVCNTPNGIH